MNYIKVSNSLEGEKFNYMLSNPLFGVDWEKAKNTITDEYKNCSYARRFGAELPRINDDSLLFYNNMIAKMKPSSTKISIIFKWLTLIYWADWQWQKQHQKMDY